MTLLAASISWRLGRASALVAALLLALLVSVVTLYLRQAARLRWRWKVTLLGLRLMPLLALSFSLLEPTVIRSARPDEQGAIVILVDQSHSMSLHDRQRRPGQWVALADGLGLLPTGLRASGDEWLTASSELTNRLADLSDAQSRLAFARISGLDTLDAEAQAQAARQRFEALARGLHDRRARPEPDAVLAGALATLASAIGRPHDADDADGWLPAVQAAVDRVAEAAGAYQFNADERLYARDARVKAICDALADKSRLQIVEEALAHPQAGLLYHLPAGAPLYGFALGDELQPLALRGVGGVPIRHLLLDTDASGMNLAEATRQAVDRLRDTPVRAVVLLSDGREPAASDAAPVAGGAPVFAVCAAPLPGPREPAVRDLSITLQPLPATVYPGQTFSVRGRVNAVGFPAGASQVVRAEFGVVHSSATQPLNRNGVADVAFEARLDSPGLQRVALRLPDVSGEANSENNLAEGWVKVLPHKTSVALVAREPRWDWRFARDALSATPGFDVRYSIEPTTLPATRSDALLVFGARHDSFDGAGWRRVTEFARDSAGLLVLTAASETTPADFASTPAAAALLPFDLPNAQGGFEWRRWAGEEPAIHFEPPNAPAADRLAWAALPPVFRYLPLPPLRLGADALLVESATRAPVIARAAIGRGKVIFVGLDETWRWRYRDNPAGENFWVDLVRQNVEPPYAVTDGVLSLDVARPALGPHEKTDVRARVSDGPSTPIALRVLHEGHEIRHTDVIGKASLEPLPLGQYTIEASADVAGVGHVVSYPLHVVGSYGGDAENPAAGRDALRRIADASGGKLLGMEQLPQLSALLAAAAQVRTVPVRLWDSAYLFVFVVACFTAEWALRKRTGLA